MQMEKRIGRHVKRYEEANEIVVITHDGPVSADEMRAINAFTVPMPNDRRFRWLLIDARKIGSVDSAALRAAREADGGTAQNFIAYVGASYALRVMMDLFVRAAGVLSGKRQFVVRFFDDMESGRAWLLEERRQALASATP